MSERLFSFDTETTGLEESDRMFGFSIANDTNASFFRNKPDHLQRRLLQDPTITWIMQNALFDMRMASYEGIEFNGPVIDIGIMARILKNNRGPKDYSLAAQSKRHLFQNKITEVEEHIKAYDLYETRKDFFGEEYKVPCYQKVERTLMDKYGAMDARLTYGLYQYYLIQLDEDDMRVVENESKLTKVLHKMERTGIKLDKTYTVRAWHHESEKKAEALTNFKESTGHEFVNSGVAIEKALGIELPRTEKGNPTLTDDVIDAMISDHPTLALVRAIRYHDKRLTTYYTNYLNSQRDSIIRPSFHQYGTTTGRFSSSNPNIQNIPAEDDGEYPVRGCFVPHEGDIFLSIDYKAQEFRLALDYAGETKLIRDIMDGADPHQATADMVGLPRKQAKNCTFAALYGAGPKKFALMTGMSEQEAKSVLMTYFARLPKLERFLWQVQKTGKSRGYVKNWFGRKLRADYNHCYALPNHLIQSSGADTMKCAMVNMELPPQVKMVATIHDELVFSMPEKDLTLVPFIQQIMESQYKPFNGMVLHTDANISRGTLAKKDMIPWNAK